jgi:hypothetical protein
MKNGHAIFLSWLASNKAMSRLGLDHGAAMAAQAVSALNFCHDFSESPAFKSGRSR